MFNGAPISIPGSLEERNKYFIDFTEDDDRLPGPAGHSDGKLVNLFSTLGCFNVTKFFTCFPRPIPYFYRKSCTFYTYCLELDNRAAINDFFFL